MLKAAENGRCQAEESVKKLQDRIWKLELSSTKCLEVPLKTSEKDRKVKCSVYTCELCQSLMISWATGASGQVL